MVQKKRPLQDLISFDFGAWKGPGVCLRMKIYELSKEYNSGMDLSLLQSNERKRNFSTSGPAVSPRSILGCNG